MKKVPMLSKSRFLAGMQCHLRLWYQCYHRELIPEIPPSRQAAFDAGYAVGKLATRLYPDGILIVADHLHHEAAVQSTLEAMQDLNVKAIYEAAFLYDDVRIRVDILQRFKDRSWNLVEVKSSTSVKEVYYPDVAVQYYVLRGCGLKVGRAGILHINNQYVYDGQNLDLESLLSFEDLTDETLAMQPAIPAQIRELRGMLAADGAPVIQPSRHCHKPHDCEFWDHCTRDMPEFWVHDINGIGQEKLNELAQLGIQKIRDIPDSFGLTDIQQRIRNCIIGEKEYISDELKAKLNDLKYPVHFLDFETIGPTVPRYGGTRPYQTLPFQWSDHILSADGSLDHLEYLCNQNNDPREEFTRTLIDALGNEGSIVVYTSYETGVLNALIEHLPQYADRLQTIIDRFVDLYAIIRRNYYHPKFYGSFSLKCVLPALVPEMSYEKLAIQDGMQASLEYLRMIDPATPAAEKDAIRNNLLTYCGQDTEAMVKIRNELLGRL